MQRELWNRLCTPTPLFHLPPTFRWQIPPWLWQYQWYQRTKIHPCWTHYFLVTIQLTNKDEHILSLTFDKKLLWIKHISISWLYNWMEIARCLHLDRLLTSTSNDCRATVYKGVKSAYLMEFYAISDIIFLGWYMTSSQMLTTVDWPFCGIILVGTHLWYCNSMITNLYNTKKWI